MDPLEISIRLQPIYANIIGLLKKDALNCIHGEAHIIRHARQHSISHQPHKLVRWINRKRLVLMRGEPRIVDHTKRGHVNTR